MILRLTMNDLDMAEQVWSLQHAAHRLEAKAVGITQFPPFAETVERLQQSTETFYGFPTTEGELLGVIAVSERVDRMVEITRLMIHPEHLRQGIGSALLRYVLERHEEARVITVTAGTANVPAVELYKRHGFVEAGMLKVMSNVELTRFILER